MPWRSTLHRSLLREVHEKTEKHATGTQGELITYDALVTAVGKAVADEYIRTKTIHFERNAQLPADTILKFPHTHLYKYDKKVWSDMNEVEKGYMAKSSGSLSSEDADVYHFALGEADLAAGGVSEQAPQTLQLPGVKQEAAPEPEAIQDVEKSGKSCKMRQRICARKCR